MKISIMGLGYVGTPKQSNGSLDLKSLCRVCEDIGSVLADKTGYHTVVVRSTVLPGTVDSIVIPVLESVSGKHHGTDFGVCMNPEFLREGSAVHDFENPPKTVIGAAYSASAEVLDDPYRTLGQPATRVDLQTAEMVSPRCLSVNLAGVRGANRDYVINKIPHISRLMARSMDAVLAHGDTLLIGNRTEEFRSVPDGLRAGQTVIDLVRIIDTPREPGDGSYEGICW